MKTEFLKDDHRLVYYKLMDKAFNAMLAIHQNNADECVGKCVETVIICDRVECPYITILGRNNELRVIPIGEIKINAEEITVVPYWKKLSHSVSELLLDEYSIKDLYSCGFDNPIITVYSYLRWHYSHEETLENTI